MTKLKLLLATMGILVVPLALVVALVALVAHGATPGDKPAKSTYGATNILNSASTKAFTGLLGRNAYQLQNRGPNSIYCGSDSAVTANTGTEVVGNGGVLSMDLTYNAAGDRDVWCIAATADQTSPANTRWIQVK